MRKVLAISLVLLVAVVAAATAKEIERTVPMMLDDQTNRGPVPGGVYGVNQAIDTFYYGGTVWDAGQTRWEAASPGVLDGWANRKMWSWNSAGFNGIAHSGENMDGWKGVDNTAMAPGYFNVKDNATLGQACVITGTKSLFCGATNAECSDLCFIDLIGTGYGNSWVQGVFTPTYTFDAGDQISLTYDATWESEVGYDFTYVILQTWDAVGSVWIDYDTLITYDDFGTVTGETFDIDATLGATGDFRFVFQFVADGGYSDGDGLNPTTCGAFALDNYSLDDNGTVFSETFEGTAVRALPASWGYYTSGCGEFAEAEWLAGLTPNLADDPCVALLPVLCSMADTVLTFTDDGAPDYPHPLCQDNYAVSPIIDFTDHPGLPGRILDFEAFRSLPLNDHVFMYWQARYKPGCASGGYSAWISDNYVYYSTEGTRCAHNIFDISTYVPPVAVEAEVALAVLNLCDEDPWNLGCTEVCNQTPYYDNVTFGIYGSTTSPYISQRELDMFEDQFAEDGTLNPSSTADTRTANYLSNLLPPIHGDTMVCRGTAANMEVWLNFRMAQVGPNQAFTAPFFTWFPNVQLGGWFAARMDTTEVTNSAGTGTVLVTGNYMTTFHELDPTAPHPEGTEILPNNIFVPGTRIEYYLAACYVGSADTFYTPLDAQSAPEEFEILPMFVSDGLGSVEWPCLIYADHFGQRGNEGLRNSTRTGTHLAANGYEYDMFNRLGPSSDLRNGIGRFAANAGQIGGPGTPKYAWGPGATIYQFLAYSHCMLNSGNIYGYSIYAADWNMFNSWLTVYTDTDHQRFLWLSGDQWVFELNRRISTGGRAFMNNVMCVANLYAYNYAITYNDFTYCLPMNGIAGGRIVSAAEPFEIRMNGCPRNFWVLGVSSATGCAAVPEIEYDSQNPDAIAAISNAPAAFYRTFAEGYDYATMRDGTAGFFTCGTDAPLTAWFASVLTWGGFTTSAVCNPAYVIDVKEPGVVPAVVTSLGQAFPNPMNPTATIKYSIGTPGKVMLRVFDVSGRVIRTLVDETKTAGQYSVIWDGKNDGGERVASGVFFYQLNAPGSELNKKIVILQ
jgi:hypothetical protein